MLEPTVKKNIDIWLTEDYDAETKAEIKQLMEAENWKALTDAFYKELEFGTGGLRGIMGTGTNRINRYTIGMATQGLSNFLKKKYPDQEIKVAVSHDSRNNSTVFAQVVADVFSANGIHVYFFDGMRPTPQLSFAIRELGCKSGVMLTASHNPREYNGYKAYGADGGQLIAPDDKNVIAEVREIDTLAEVNFKRNEDLITRLGDDIDEKFIAAVISQSINPEVIQVQKDLKIVFSPIHGTGAVHIPHILRRMGFENVQVVAEQMTPDGNFPTVVYPNPEEEEALTLAIKQANEIGADLVMATDPDADRVGIAVRDSEGKMVLLNGNQTASLLFYYVLSAWKKASKLDGNQYIVKTIVTSYLLDEIAKSMGVKCYNTLTGFKYIGALMTEFEGAKQFVIGGEESYGYLVGDHARDKDAVVSCALIAEMAAYYKNEGKTLYDALQELHEKYGVYLEKLIAVKKTGKEGAEEIQNMMAEFRANPPESLGGSSIIRIKDYQSSEEKDMTTGITQTIDLPTSNVLQFFTADGSIISARPSGTEPKIKFYCSVHEDWQKDESYEDMLSSLEQKIDQIMDDLLQ